MMYYIEKPNTWSPANRKCKELQEYVDQFKNCLIPDDLSRDALIEDIRHKVEELNQAYPRTKKLVVTLDHHHHDFISCQPEFRKIEDEYVFTIRLLPVRRTYRFSESAAASLLKEGGDR
ncbi:MAG: hypothetical protein IKK04_10240 [Bacteroidales bacterium]|nr:hypothetical protein [Bacteroidales bacterium]